ncbi:helix-turn-helix domain-containing protein [Paenibacillus alvei]|uniref:Helix-turn-helix domain-containing protein n=1 Tax=Paenibacillus alvei TaxID=44250 RepID=A0AAP7DHN0_PAEAL|nr:helix-turn-helix domain-containing protein [Paenibacillus alvei]NEZ40959.1 helix-turn-helix domain-containing protein [Paenibacillus alvei]NOJ69774.1 helix-turn-helix domain-containing protein [Paenibacillus alvei]
MLWIISLSNESNLFSLKASIRLLTCILAGTIRYLFPSRRFLEHAQGWPTRIIAQELGRHHSSVAHELKRNQMSNMNKADKA